MITILYYYSLVALCIATSILGLLFLTQFNENREAMRNYRIAKRLLAIAFFIVAIGNLVELFGHTNKPIDTANQGFFLSQIITLSISVTQAFIFTLVCVMLLDPKNIQSKQLKRQIIAIVLYVAVAVVSYILLPISAAKISIFLLSIIYCIVLIYFTVFFHTSLPFLPPSNGQLLFRRYSNSHALDCSRILCRTCNRHIFPCYHSTFKF